MSDGPALRAAICAHPDDDTVRLVYADWLDENKRAKRAAFVRARVELDRLQAADTPERYVAFYISDLFSTGADRIDWAAVDPPLATHLSAVRRLEQVPGSLTLKAEGVPKVPSCAVQTRGRGFYDTVIVDNATRFLERADELFRAAPIDSVVFEELTADEARDFVNAGYLARVRDLEFGYSIEPEAVRVFGAHPDAAGVKRVEFDESGTGDHIDALAAGKHWTGLRALHLIDVETSDDPPAPGQLAALFARPLCRGLREVVAWGGGLNAECARALATKCPELRHLDIGLNDIGPDGARAIAGSKALRRLAFLDVSSCAVDSGEAQAALVTSPNLSELRVLRAGGNGSAGPSAKGLARASRGPTLRALELNSCSVPAAGALAECPALAGLYALTFDGGGLSDAAAARFFRRARFEHLVYLDLAFCGIGEAGAKALAEWPGAARLQWLNLSENTIGSGMSALIKSRYLTNLKYLDASGRGLRALQKHFKKAMR